MTGQPAAERQGKLYALEVECIGKDKVRQP
jgi:hypothetical protein